MADKKAALPAPKEQGITKSLSIADQVEKELQELTQANFYPIPLKGGGQRLEPDARALQHFANKAGGFCTKILESGMDEEKAWALVQMWPQGKPAMVKEDKVTIVYAIEFQNLVWDRVDKGCQRHKAGCPLVRDEKGQVIFMDSAPVLVEPACQMELRRQLNRKMKFAERECVTKAEGRLHKKFLNFEWRDEDEILNEAAEVAIVASDKGQRQPEKTEEAPAPVPSVKQQSVAAEKPPQPMSEVLPKAVIPSDEEMRRRAEGQPVTPVAAVPQAQTKKPNGSGNGTTVPPRKRSERMAELCSTVGCSSTNILAFIGKSLGVDQTQIKEKCKGEEIDSVITGLEKCAKEFGPKFAGPFIRHEMKEGPEHRKISRFFLTVFAEEMKHYEAGGER